MTTQLREIVSLLQEINTAHVDESASQIPEFRIWWKAHCHEFPECLKDVIATGFAAGFRSCVTELREEVSELAEQIKDEAEKTLKKIKGML